MEKLTENQLNDLLIRACSSLISKHLPFGIFLSKLFNKRLRAKKEKVAVETFVKFLKKHYPETIGEKKPLMGKTTPLKKKDKKLILKDVYKKEPLATLSENEKAPKEIPLSIPQKINFLRIMASRHGFKEIALQEKDKLISFQKDGIRMNIYYTTMTVGTCLAHPKHEHPTQLFRRNVTSSELEAIFINPRTHTGKGYIKK